MKILKIFAVALMLLPLMLDAKPKPKAKTAPTRPSAEQLVDLYPMFDNALAANLWGKWRHDETQMSQDDYAQVLELCIIAYDYLNAGYSDILTNISSLTERRRVASDLNDIGKSGNMVTFVRTFSNRMHHLAAEGRLNQENTRRAILMLEKKKEFNRLNDEIYC